MQKNLAKHISTRIEEKSCRFCHKAFVAKIFIFSVQASWEKDANSVLIQCDKMRKVNQL